MERKKYPKSWHLNYSEKSFSDDKRHINDYHFRDNDIVCTIKMDGENTTIYNDHIHARSLDSLIDGEDRRWVDALRQSKIENKIPKSMRICGENLFYKHTCSYENLESMFYVFSIWDNDICLSWNDTTNICRELGLTTVPVIYNGLYNKDNILSNFREYINLHNEVEGFVVRLKNSFNVKDFNISLNKYVRKTFVLPPNHWRRMPKTLNKLKNNKNPWEII